MLDKRRLGKYGFEVSHNLNLLIYSLDQVRVYKGGSWKDRAYWLNPGTRRFLDQDQASDHIGFRCAMTRLGSKSKKKKSARHKRRG